MSARGEWIGMGTSFALKGCFTALVTPFKGSGVNPPVDYEAFKRLVELQNEGRVAGIVPCGTTGESPTLSHEEHNKLVSLSVEACRGIVIAGTGSNCTREAIAMTKHAADAGAHASLQVCPYYNKPNQEGLFRHFAAVAEAADIPMILYNIPGRSGREIAPETMARLAAEHSNVVAVKEASGKEETWKKIRETCPKSFTILSGNDNETLNIMKNYGAAGAVSVASNVIPRRMRDFVSLGLEKRFAEMGKEGARLDDFFEKLFIDTNPIMVKTALGLLGLPAGGFRLPMCETSGENAEKMGRCLAALGLGQKTGVVKA